MKLGSTEITAIKIGNTAINKIYKDGVLYWQTGVLIPSNPDVLFWLDGTIIDVSGTKYFQDQTTNARNFLITDYDFSDDWTIGFPYKSAAKISAPAGDAVLIAADINNYLYDSGGTPNQIPVISLFQDIDYAHKLFTRHAAQVLDVNSVETYEPRVLDIVFYNTIKAGDDLIACQSYYEVPTESATALWVSKTGNDTTGDGTKTNPYLTITKFITVGNTKTCYVKSGSYNEAITFNNKQMSIIAIGFNNLPTTTTPSIYYNTGAGSNTTIQGFVSTGVVSMRIRMTVAATLFFNKVKFIGETANTIYNSAGISPVTINNSYLTNQFSTLSDLTFNDCYFDVLLSMALFVGGSAGKKTSLSYCKITEITSTGMFNPTAVSQELSMFNCEYFGNTCVDGTNAYAPKITIERCLIKLKTKSIFQSTHSTGIRTIEVNNNIVTSVGSVNTLLNSIGKGTVEVKDNIITGELRDFSVLLEGLDVSSSNEFSGNSVTSNTVYITVRNTQNLIQSNLLDTNESSVYVTVSIAGLGVVSQVKGNTIITRTGDSALIILGTEGGAVSYGMLDGSVVSENKLLAPKYFENDPGAQHGIFIYSQTVEAKFNYLNGTFLGYVMKSAGGTYQSVVHHNIVIDTNNPFLSKGAIGVSYFNNTAIWTKTTSSTMGLVLMADELYPGSESINTQFKNNIIADFRSAIDNTFIQANTTSNLVGAEIDYNIYYKANLNQDHFARVDNAWLTFTQWQALGFDSHSILLTDAQAQGLFTDYDNNDYSLKAGSLAIGAGETLDVAYDDGLDASTNWGADTELPVVVTKQQGASWDIGAYVS